MKRILKARNMSELIAKIYDDNGWVRKAGESRTARIKPLYDVEANYKTGFFVATRKKGT